LKSLSFLVWIGAGVFLFGIASAAWPPLKAIVGSMTCSVWIIVGGLALMVLPTLVVGHELLILGAVAVVIVGWFIAHRHGSKSTEAKVLRSFLSKE
jgi:hypothetical protein